MIHPAYQLDHYLIQAKTAAITRTVWVYGPEEDLVLFCRQKVVRIRQELTVWTEEAQTNPILRICARPGIALSTTYEVTAVGSGALIGYIRRMGLRSPTRELWQLTKPDGQEAGLLRSDPLSHPGRRWNLSYQLIQAGQPVGSFRRQFRLMRDQLEIVFSPNSEGKINRPLELAAAILLISNRK